MVNSDDFGKAVELIEKSGRVLVTTHTKPDGDACGCVAVLCDALAALGKDVQPLMLSGIPQWYEFLFAEKVPVLGKDLTAEQLAKGRLGEFDLIIIVDTNSYSQLGDLAPYLKKKHKPILVIDHHVTSDSIGTVRLVDSTAAATGLIVFDLIRHGGWILTEKMAEAIFVAIATDTGWFQFSNTDSRVYNACAQLVDSGARPTEIHGGLYQNLSYERFQLMLRMLKSLELHFDGRYACQQLTREDFEQTRASYKDTENLIDECKRIGSVEVVGLFVEQEDGRIRCSMRSTGSVNVCNIMLKFGGGGHAMAAASSHYGSIEDVRQKVLAEVKKEFL